MKNIFALLGVLLIYGCRAQQKTEPIASAADDNSLLWEISGRSLSKPSYLYGTFHMMCREDIRISKNLSEAMNRSSDVYFEMDLDDASNTLGAIFFMNMKNGKTLKDLYTEEEFDRLNRYFTDSIGSSLVMMQRMKPMFLEAMLIPKLMPCTNMSGVEQELMKIAKAGKKEIKGLETIAFQASVFDSIPYGEQAKELLKNIDSIAGYRPLMAKMISAYKNQQLKELEKLMLDESSGMAEHMDILLTKRNINWVDQLNKIMPEKNVFVAVGAGHLLGENGLISLLRKEGYTVRALENIK